jgi:hypothetical protein
VQSENERLAADGHRIHTGKSDELNRRFARSFTDHFPKLCAKYPIYAELRNLAEMALVAALIREHGLAEQVGWPMLALGDPRVLPVPLAEPPKEVDTVINHRVANRIHVIAGVSGGVRIDPSDLVTRSALTPAPDSRLDTQHNRATPPTTEIHWWWD